MIKTIPKPAWIEAEAVVDWMLWMRWKSVLHAMGFKKGPGDEWVPINPTFTTSEQQAIDAAKRGKPQELVGLIKAEISRLEADPDHASKLTPATLRLIAEFLSGKRNLKTGRDTSEKEQRGRPKMSKLERINRTPTHDAAMLYFPAVKKVLREEYPDQTPEDIRDRALEIVERGYPVKGNTVTNYRNRPKRGPHRV
jgi:hypothetical protein